MGRYFVVRNNTRVRCLVGFDGRQLKWPCCCSGAGARARRELCPAAEIPQGRKERTGGLLPHKQLWNEDEIQCLFFLPETIGNVALM